MTKGPGDRKSPVSKAGKRSGSQVYPALISAERRAAKDWGEQQFVSRHPLTVEREGTVIVFDQKTKQFVYRTKKVQVSTDCIYDPKRGRVVYTPSAKEKNQ